MARPAGTVTFLFTDIEGSTRLWQEAPDAMASALARHDAIVRGAIEAHHGQVFATGGDGFAAVFERASDAVAAARDAQSGLAEEPWPSGAVVRARMGVHTGEAVERDGDYFGRAVNQAARLMALGRGGQVLCSATTAAVVDDLGEASDLGEHRLRDVAVPVRVFQLGHGEFPPLRSAGVAPTNLPYAPTELLGRDADVADLAALVTEQRLVTLTGTGGIGKTRLAVEVAATVADRFPDGVWFVDLTPVVEDDDLARAVAAAMGATGAVGSDAAALVRYLEQRQALLVLDNCEHVIDGAAALLDEVVAGCPEVRILATSRELLDVPAEVVHWVTPLPVPEGVEGATASPAVRLFEERARAVRPQFSVTEENAADVVEICRRLDGVPLAVELAAARVASMSPSDIRERLGERFRLLAGGRRRQDRHRTLLAAVGWSYDLLDPEAQQVFRALSVFAGSFDLTAAAAVAGGDDLDEFAVTDLVAGLANRSLVVHDGDSGRYRLLESLRQYGADRLVEDGESVDVQERFAAYFADLARRDGPLLGAAGVADVREQLRAELDNFRAYAEWLTETGQSAEVVGLAKVLGLFLSQEAPVTGRSWLEPLVDGDGLDDPQVRYDALWVLGWMCIVMGDIDGAIAAGAAWRGLVAEHPGIVEDPWALTPELIVSSYTFDHAATEILSAQMRALGASRDDDYAVHMANCYALLAMEVEDPGFEGALERAIAVGEASGNPGWLAGALTCAGGPLMGHTYTDATLEKVLDLYETHPGWEEAGQLYGAITAQQRTLALTRRSATDAIRVGLAGVRLSDRIGFDMQFSGCLETLMLATALAGQVDSARRLRSYLLTADLLAMGPRERAYAETEAALAAAGVDLDARDHGIATRRELLDLLDEIESALER